MFVVCNLIHLIHLLHHELLWIVNKIMQSFTRHILFSFDLCFRPYFSVSVAVFTRNGAANGSPCCKLIKTLKEALDVIFGAMLFQALWRLFSLASNPECPLDLRFPPHHEEILHHRLNVNDLPLCFFSVSLYLFRSICRCL